MSLELHINGKTTSASPGKSLFDCAETLGIRVPTSCNKTASAANVSWKFLRVWICSRRARPRKII